MRAITGLWRWRHNPLRRTTDLVEAWVALTAAVLIALGAAVAGWAVTAATHDALLRTVDEQHRQRHLVWVTVQRLLPRAPVNPDPETTSTRAAHRRALANWTAPDGSTHTDTVAAPRGVQRGDRFRIWTDQRGRIVPRPLDADTARTHSVIAGLGGAAAAAGLVEGARRLTVWRLTLARHRRWDQEWERAGQDWGRTGADS